MHDSSGPSRGSADFLKEKGAWKVDRWSWDSALAATDQPRLVRVQATTQPMAEKGAPEAASMKGAETTAAAPASGALSLGALLLRATRLSPEQLDDARARAEDQEKPLTEVLVESGMLGEDEILQALGAALELPVTTEIAADRIDTELVDKIPIAFAKAHGLLPLERSTAGVVHVAVSDPFDTDAIDDLRLLFDGSDVEPALASRRAMQAPVQTPARTRSRSTPAPACSFWRARRCASRTGSTRPAPRAHPSSCIAWICARLRG